MVENEDQLEEFIEQLEANLMYAIDLETTLEFLGPIIQASATLSIDFLFLEISEDFEDEEKNAKEEIKKLIKLVKEVGENRTENQVMKTHWLYALSQFDYTDYLDDD